MKPSFLALAFALAATSLNAQHPFDSAGSGVAQGRSSDATADIVTSYLALHAALAGDRFEQVKAPADVIATRAAALGKEGADIAKAAASVAGAANITAARDAFGPLSDRVIARVKADAKSTPPDLRLAFCPMVKRSWLQRDQQVRNPYAGASMLTCGELKPLK
jgi:Protein of unknown function (DUF3347)